MPFFTDFNLTVRLTSGPLKIRLEQQGSLKLEIGGKINLRLLPSLWGPKNGCRGDIRERAQKES